VKPDLGSPPALRATSPASGEGIRTPPWLWVALLAGAVVTTWWAWFVFGFIQEPSAVGRVLIALLTMIGTSLFAGLAAAVGAFGLALQSAWGRPVAWIAAVAVTLTGVGAIAGIPSLIGLWWSRKERRSRLSD